MRDLQSAICNSHQEEAMEDVYRQLARRLDAIPNGFPATESGVELRLLAKIFAPQEAALAAQMRMGFESAEAIAARAGVTPETARKELREMVRRGLIRARRAEGQLMFALMPFVVGFYEEQLPRLDAELATLAEQYFAEIGGRTILDIAPSLHRVVPVGQAVSVDLHVFPYEQATAIVESARSWGVRDCICRVQQRLVGKGCRKMVEACLMLAPIEGVFQDGGVTRPISKEEALQILRETDEAGLVHSTGNFRDDHYYICNCCTCCCAVLRGLVEYGVPTAVARSGFRSSVDDAACIGCGDCVARCPFKALSLADDVAVVDGGRCLGCGVCVGACPSGALRLERRPDVAPLPTDIKDWAMQRAAARGISAAELEL
jgi:ferredoxin